MPPPSSHEPLTIGERLRKRREALGLQREDVAGEIASPVKYIIALEGDQYEIFSAKVYAHGFLKKLLVVLSFEEAEILLKEFDAEWEIRVASGTRRPIALPENRSGTLYLTARHLVYGIGGVLFLGLLVFFGFQVSHFVGIPELAIETPQEGATFTEPVIRVRGSTGRESRLTINGREISIDAEGKFDDELGLGAGFHTLEFLAENRFGKIQKATRHVLIK